MSPRKLVIYPVPLLLLLVGSFSSCGAVPSKEIQEMLVQKGFGKRAQGDVRTENYAIVGSTIQFFPDPAILTNPAYIELFLLAQLPQPVGIDGTIYLPSAGSVYVLGLTEKEIGGLITEKMGALWNDPVRIDARIIGVPTQLFYLFGAMGQRPLPLFQFETIFELFAFMPATGLANIGKVRLIRPDPKNPLIVTINVRDMVLWGNTTYNLRIHENDIIYVPATFLGQISRFLERLVQPLTTVVSALFQGVALQYQYRVLTGQQDLFFFPGGGRIF